MADLLETHADGVVTLTLNRPDRMNAFSDEMLRGLAEAFPRLGADPAVGAIVLTGAGRAFCAGGDVKAMASRTDAGFEERLEALRWKQQIPVLMRMCPKVIVARVNGAAIGAGLALSLAADLRLAAETATFGTAFAGIGFSGDFGASWLLTRLVGTAKARELCFLGDKLDSAEALRCGLVSRVAAPDTLDAEVAALARRLATGPRVALGYMKRNLHAAETEPLATVLEMEAIHQIRTALTDDHKEAAAAFVGRRAPVFRGR